MQPPPMMCSLSDKASLCSDQPTDSSNTSWEGILRHLEVLSYSQPIQPAGAMDRRPQNHLAFGLTSTSAWAQDGGCIDSTTRSSSSVGVSVGGRTNWSCIPVSNRNIPSRRLEHVTTPGRQLLNNPTRISPEPSLHSPLRVHGQGLAMSKTIHRDDKHDDNNGRTNHMNKHGNCDTGASDDLVTTLDSLDMDQIPNVAWTVHDDAFEAAVEAIQLSDLSHSKQHPKQVLKTHLDDSALCAPFIIPPLDPMEELAQRSSSASAGDAVAIPSLSPRRSLSPIPFISVDGSPRALALPGCWTVPEAAARIRHAIFWKSEEQVPPLQPPSNVPEWESAPTQHATISTAINSARGEIATRIARNSLVGKETTSGTEDAQPHGPEAIVEQELDLTDTMLQDDIFIKQPNPNDVVCERGSRSNSHPGNRRYLDRLLELQPAYKASKRGPKSSICMELIRWVQDTQHGRFLRQDKVTRHWYVADEKFVRNKVGQSLRADHTAEGREAKRQRYSAIANPHDRSTC